MHQHEAYLPNSESLSCPVAALLNKQTLCNKNKTSLYHSNFITLHLFFLLPIVSYTPLLASC